MDQPAITIYMCVLSCLVWIPSIESTSGKTTLTATPLEPVVGSSVTLSCNYSGTNVLGSSTWSKNNVLVGRLIHIDNGCFEGTQIELDNYTALCTSKEFFTLTLVSVTLYLHGTSWRCEQAGRASNSVVLTLKVPVNSLSFETSDSSMFTLRENISKRISCSTSFSRPRANITWYITERTELSKLFIQESDSIYNTSTEFVSTRSTLHVNLNRTYNQWILVCEAENIQGYKAVSKNISLNITYPTNKPSILCTENGIYNVILNHKGKLICSVYGGNPAGILHWNCTGDVTEYRGPHNNVSQTVVWNATQPQYCTCKSTNIAGASSASVKTEVLCKPRLDMNSNVQFVVTSAINQTATMSYTVLAYPYPSFIWYRNGLSINTRGSRINIFSTDMQTYLIINHVGEKDFGEYTLTVTNDLGSVNELFHFKPQESTVQPCNSTSQNVSAIIGGTLSGLVVLCGMVFSVFIYRRRYFHSPLKNEQQECSTVQSPIPVTYENLKINQIPNDTLEVHIETAGSHTSETNLDHTYEGMSRENDGKETEYTSLGDNIIGCE